MRPAAAAAKATASSTMSDDAHAEDVRRSVREIKAPEAFTYEAKKKAAIEAAGTGTSLSEIEPVVEKLKNTTSRDPALKQIHTIMFSRAGSQKELKANILKFNGLPVEVAAAEGFQERLTGKLLKYSLANLKTIFDILCINRSSPSFDGAQPSKEQLVDRLAGWLVAPKVRACARACGESGGVLAGVDGPYGCRHSLSRALWSRSFVQDGRTHWWWWWW